MTVTHQAAPRYDKAAVAAFLLGAGIVMLYIFVQNIAPYGRFVHNMLSNGIEVIPWLGVRLQSQSEPIAFVVGIAALIAIQAGEVLAMLTYAHFGMDRYRLAVALGVVCYGFDALACSVFWPPVTIPLDQFFAAPTMGAISWFNIAVAALTLFGFGLYTWLLVEFRVLNVPKETHFIAAQRKAVVDRNFAIAKYAISLSGLLWFAAMLYGGAIAVGALGALAVASLFYAWSKTETDWRYLNKLGQRGVKRVPKKQTRQFYSGLSDGEREDMNDWVESDPVNEQPTSPGKGEPPQPEAVEVPAEVGAQASKVEPEAQGLKRGVLVRRPEYHVKLLSPSRGGKTNTAIQLFKDFGRVIYITCKAADRVPLNWDGYLLNLTDLHPALEVLIPRFKEIFAEQLLAENPTPYALIVDEAIAICNNAMEQAETKQQKQNAVAFNGLIRDHITTGAGQGAIACIMSQTQNGSDFPGMSAAQLQNLWTVICGSEKSGGQFRHIPEWFEKHAGQLTEVQQQELKSISSGFVQLAMVDGEPTLCEFPKVDVALKPCVEVPTSTQPLPTTSDPLPEVLPTTSDPLPEALQSTSEVDSDTFDPENPLSERSTSVVLQALRDGWSKTKIIKDLFGISGGDKFKKAATLIEPLQSQAASQADALETGMTSMI